MPRMVQCVYLKKEAEGMDYAPYPGELGKRIYNSVSEEALLRHVYGGPAPPALRDGLVAPLLGDPRFERRADGNWSLAGATASADAFTALAIAATGPSSGV